MPDIMDMIDNVDEGGIEVEVTGYSISHAVRIDICDMNGIKIGEASGIRTTIEEQEHTLRALTGEGSTERWVSGIRLNLDNVVFWGPVDLSDFRFHVVVTETHPPTAAEPLDKTEIIDCLVFEYTRPVQFANQYHYDKMTMVCKKILTNGRYIEYGTRLVRNGGTRAQKELAKTVEWLERWGRK